MSFLVRRVRDPHAPPIDMTNKLRLDAYRLELGTLGSTSDKLDALEILVHVEGVPMPASIVLRERKHVQQLIDALAVVRDAVWPKGGE